MVESDQSDKESQDEMPPLEVLNSSVEAGASGQKRLRGETSDDETSHLPSKRTCVSIDEATSKEHKTEYTLEVNGTTKDTRENKKNGKTTEKIETGLKEDNAILEIKSKEASINNDIETKEEDESDDLTDAKQKENNSANVSTEDSAIKEENEGEEKDNIKQKKEHRRSQIEDAEVVEGLELSVECASDKESSSTSESEDEKDKKPKPKTIIVKAKPNDSELDVSSSEAEKSDSQDASEVTPKQTAKKGKKRGKTSFSKTKNTDSEDNSDSISDEDYSPRTKRKLKKTVANKKSTESKRGRSRTKKVAKTSIEEKDEEDENSNVAEDVNAERNSSNTESIGSKSDDENDSKDGKRRSTSSTSEKKIQLLKKYIRMAGIHVKSYNDLWAGYKTNTAKINCLKELLAKNGVTGRPTIEKCKKAKKKNERLKDIAELNTSNIISEGRVTRAQRNKDSNKELTQTSETPTKHREARHSFKRVLCVVDSDSE
ncbi:HIRA-interacting protein 3 [Anthophora plagiata]